MCGCHPFRAHSKLWFLRLRPSFSAGLRGWLGPRSEVTWYLGALNAGEQLHWLSKGPQFRTMTLRSVWRLPVTVVITMFTAGAWAKTGVWGNPSFFFLSASIPTDVNRAVLYGVHCDVFLYIPSANRIATRLRRNGRVFTYNKTITRRTFHQQRTRKAYWPPSGASSIGLLPGSRLCLSRERGM